MNWDTDEQYIAKRVSRALTGALCPLVGCAEYGCPGADVKGASDV